ncbi:hypothetical protein HDV63DRAFT_207960 [Trichoderma sp. SZMC 28014]
MGCFFFKAPSKSLHALVRSLLTILSVPSRHWFLWVLTLISRWARMFGFFFLPLPFFHYFSRFAVLFLEWPRKHTLQGMRLTSLGSYGTVNHASLQSTLIAKSRSQLFTTLLGGS